MFVVLDEAHNLIPAEPRGKAEIILREQFRTIAAEGRKFGMFLILATQRPDKIDPMVLSECENKALMRVNSRSVFNLTTQLLGLQEVDPEITEKSLDPGIGRALLLGPWSQEVPTWVYSAARRTVEGGRNLDADFWTMSPF
jgi:DNA helicase HerA-like ATPase